MLRYDVTLGYTGYFESSVSSSLKDVVRIDNHLLALSGKAVVQKGGLGQESSTESILQASNKCCVEIVNLQTNSLVCKLIN